MSVSPREQCARGQMRAQPSSASILRAMSLDRYELDQHIAEQIGFLKASAAAYDAGMHAEAKRMAVAIRVLVHETASSHSLLGQIGQLDRLGFAASGEAIPENVLVATGPLTSLKGGPDGPVVSARLVDPVRWLPFATWWREPIYVAIDGSFTRERFVLDLANKGGGAHVDRRLGNTYRQIVHDHVIGWQSGPTDGPESFENQMNNPVPASVRAITHELLTSLERL
jgi:hypothetical protein